jgi:hypothetical protein
MKIESRPNYTATRPNVNIGDTLFIGFSDQVRQTVKITKVYLHELTNQWAYEGTDHGVLTTGFFSSLPWVVYKRASR